MKSVWSSGVYMRIAALSASYHGKKTCMNNFPVRTTRNLESNPMGSLNPITASVWRQSRPMVARLNPGTLSGHLGIGCHSSTLSVHHNCQIIGLNDTRLQQHLRLWRQLLRIPWRRQNESSNEKLSPGSPVLPEKLVVRCDPDARENGSPVRRLILWGSKPRRPTETVIDEVLSKWRPEILIWNEHDIHAAQTRDIMITKGHWDGNKPEKTDIWNAWDLDHLNTLLVKLGPIDSKVETIMIMATEISHATEISPLSIRELERVTRILVELKMPFHKGNKPFVAVLESRTKGPWAKDTSLREDGEWKLKNKYMLNM